MSYALAAYFFLHGELHRRVISEVPLTWQECQDDMRAMPPTPFIVLACETET